MGAHIKALVVRCEVCSQCWLVRGLGGDDTYACKACGFVINVVTPPNVEDESRG